MESTVNNPSPRHAGLATTPDEMQIVLPDIEPNEYGHLMDGMYFDGLTWEASRPTLRCKVEVAPGVEVAAYLIHGDEHRNKLYVQPVGENLRTHWTEGGLDIQDVDPFVTLDVIGTAHTKTMKVKRNAGWSRQPRVEEVIDKYDPNYWSVPGNHRTRDKMYNRGSQAWDAFHIPYLYLRVRVTHTDTGAVAEGEMRFRQPSTGRVSLSDHVVEHGAELERSLYVRSDFHGYSCVAEFDCYEWSDFCALVTRYNLAEPVRDYWTWWLKAINSPVSPDKAELASVKSLWNRKTIRPNLDRLRDEEPLLHRYFLWLHDKQTQDKTTNNRLLAAFLKEVGEDYDALKKALDESIDGAPAVGMYEPEGNVYGSPVGNRGICLVLPGAREQETERRAKDEWQFRQGAKAQAEGLGIDPARHPKTLAAIESGDLPLSVFHEPGDEKHLINVEFDLWERALGEPGWAEVILPAAQNASRRGTYSKRFTSFLSFLYKLPAYLDRHAPRPGKAKWKAVPKFVQSQWELEMDEADEDGTTNRRSAMTPVADNENGTVEIPYVAMSISGAFTTWCYSDQYFVAEAGLNDPIGEGVFVNDLAEKLNGRDDYGLMFYTLMGTDRNTGYPTFLVIFERLPKRKDLKITTRVHFHRVHPCRSKKGTPTPTCRLIEECYRYMAGNVRVEEITAQQGDLIFIRCDKPGKAVEDAVPVAAFESHRFVPLADGAAPAIVVRSVAKAPTNRLGYIHCEHDFAVRHPEHEDIEKLDAGWWEIRRCKSWEANPTAVWSLTID